MKRILKFGGTSVGSATNMRRVAEIITERNSTITVLSAMSGTTDSLASICSIAQKGGDSTRVTEIIETIRVKYTDCINDLLEAGRREAIGLLEQTLEIIADAAVWYRKDLSEKIILAQGELLTSAIFMLYLTETGRRAVLLHAPDFMHKEAGGRIDMALLREKLAGTGVGAGAGADARAGAGADAGAAGTLYITQGFICTGSDGNLDNLGRGGSDYSAALIGAAIGADQVEIWTDIDGMHNNDPRYVEQTYPIRRMSFDEAAELAYFGAKILHPETIIPCRECGIPVLLKNTLDPDAEGTLITDSEDPAGKVFRAVAAKDGITVIRIHSARMLMAYGFLRQVFEIFERHRTPIDMIATSEVAVSLTIDSDIHLDEIASELASLGTIEIERQNTIVCVVGNMEHSSKGIAARIFEGVNGIPVKMISYGASHRSMALLIETQYKREFLRNLNDHLFGHA